MSQEVAGKLQGIILKYGYNDSEFNEKRTEEINILIDENFLEDVSDPWDILDKNYSRDTLFTELSKKQYDISPNTGTTKQQMIDWILKNSEQLESKLTRKYATLNYSDKIKPHIKELKKLINELDIRHTYREERVLLSDFYYTLEEEKSNENLDDSVKEIIEQWSTQPSEKKKTTALLLCVFGGYFGLHHFYVGKIGMGILYFCTVGLFCFGWIADIIKIAIGKFKDKNNHFLK